MPKQIADVKSKLFHTAKHILKTEGYAALSMRKVAKECSIAVGTVYNYVQNKEELVALVIMEDWTLVLERMNRAAAESEDAADGFRRLYRVLADFVAEYQEIWNQYSQVGGSSKAIDSHHLMLREQIAAQIRHMLERFGKTAILPLSSLLAEMVLAAVMQPDLDEDQVSMLIERIL